MPRSGGVNGNVLAVVMEMRLFAAALQRCENTALFNLSRSAMKDSHI